MELLLIRHGEARYGDNDGLTDLGARQAQLLAERLAQDGIHHLYASPMPRARDTAQIVAASTGRDLLFDDRFREIDTGDHKTTVDGNKRWNLSKELGEPLTLDFSASNGEGPAQLYQRVSSVLHDVLVQRHAADDERVALIAHGGFINAALHHFVGMPFEGNLAFFLHNTSISIVRVLPNSNRILNVNDVHHLLPLGPL